MTAPGSVRDRLRAQLADLKMPGALEALDDILTRIDGGHLHAAAALDALLGAQIALRNARRLTAAMRSSRLPAIKTLTDFDFTFQPSLKREQIDSLHTLGFIERRENVIFLGPPGVGKTHCEIEEALVGAPPELHVGAGSGEMTQRLIGQVVPLVPWQEICLSSLSVPRVRLPLA
jgi:hypothetical protein